MKDKGKLIGRYKEAKWRRLRQAILIRDNYERQYFKRYGIYKVASVVYHIVSATEDEIKFYDSNTVGYYTYDLRSFWWSLPIKKGYFRLYKTR